MPVWNRAELVSNAIKSVLAQTFKDYELIIIDYGSDDKARDVITPYLCEKVIYHRSARQGLSAARNYGLEKAKYPFIAHLDPVSAWHADFLATMHDILNVPDAPPEVAYCITDVYKIKTANGTIAKHSTKGEPFSFRKLMKENYIDINAFVHSCKALDFAGRFDEKLKGQADLDFIVRMTSLFEPAFVQKALVDRYSTSHSGKLISSQGIDLPWRTVGIKHAEFKEPIVFVHDAIEYKWENMPEEKYLNWVRVHHWQLNTSDYTAWGYPFMLQIEPTNVCNLKCPLCPAGKGKLGRKAQHMSLETYKSIIDDMERYLMILILWDWGEPFMNPDFPEMIRYASERDIRTVTSTNAQFLKNQAYVESILKSGLSTLIVAVDSACEHGYEDYRKGGSLDSTLSGLQKLIETKKRVGSNTMINMRMVIMKSNEHELPKIRRLARKIGADWFSVKTVHLGYDETTPDSEVVAIDPRYRYYAYKPGTYERIRIDIKCRKCWETASIYSNGDVVPCCYDYDGTLKQGNVFEQPLTKLWNSRSYRDFRKSVYHHMQSMPLCKDCEINYKLSKTGWFSESHHTDYLKRLQNCFREPLGRRLLLTAKSKLHKLRHRRD
jgi:radical SAM protein with 4Fe4S-binding SPASM domain